MAPPRLAVIDYDAGNLASITQGLRRAGAAVTPLRRPQGGGWDGIVLPGVGAYGAAMARLAAAGFTDWIREEVQAGTPLLGVCLGMQLLYEWSGEGGTVPGLAVLPGAVRRLPEGLKVPHMGWNRLWVHRPVAVLEGIPPDAYVYFAHSYIVIPAEAGDVAATVRYGVRFPAVVARRHVVGMQFHPEKSGEVGQHILRNVVTWAATPAPERREGRRRP